MKRYRSWLAKAALALWGVFMGLLMAEVALRLRGVPYDLLVHHPDPALKYTLKPGLRGHLGEIQHSHNSRGLRDAEFADLPRPGTSRILCIGDSVSHAQTLPLETTFAKRLEASLNGGNPGAYEVINGGVSGYSACQEEAFYRQIASTYHPHLVVWQYCLNDPEDPWDPIGESNKGFVPIPMSLKWSLREHVVLWGFLRANTFTLLRQAGWLEDVDDASTVEYSRRVFAFYEEEGTARLDAAWACVRRAADAIRSTGGRMLLVVVPFATQMDAAGGFGASPQREIARRCAEAGIACLDPLEEFRRHGGKDLYLTPDLVHLSAKGHQVLADSLREPATRLLESASGEEIRSAGR